MFTKLFIRAGQSNFPDETADIDAVRQAFSNFLISPSAADVQRALVSWAWLQVPRTPPIFVTAFGDMLFRRQHDVAMLSTLDGSFAPVAKSVRELRERLSDVETQDDVFNSVWVQAAQRQGLVLASDACFDWLIAPVLGGAIEAENIGTMNFVAKLSIAGQLHRQVQSSLPGTTVGRITVSD